jgi:hypothetical protein
MSKNLTVKSGNLEIKTKELSIPFRFYDPRIPPIPIPFWILHVKEVEIKDNKESNIARTLRYDADKEAFLDGADQGQSYSYEGDFTKRFNDLVDEILPEIISDIDDYLRRKVN